MINYELVMKTQICEAERNGALFVSTMFISKTLITHSHELQMPVLCGVSSLSEARQALLWGAEALKFYPATSLKPSIFKNIMTELKNDGTLSSSNVTDIVVAGGALGTDFEAYLSGGATSFAVGFDCKKMTPSQIRISLKELNKIYSSFK